MDHRAPFSQDPKDHIFNQMPYQKQCENVAPFRKWQFFNWDALYYFDPMPIVLFTHADRREPQLFLIELQGNLELNAQRKATNDGEDLIMISAGDVPQLRLGHQVLEGKRIELERPLLLIKVACPSKDRKQFPLVGPLPPHIL